MCFPGIEDIEIHSSRSAHIGDFVGLENSRSANSFGSNMADRATRVGSVGIPLPAYPLLAQRGDLLRRKALRLYILRSLSDEFAG